MVDSTSQNDFPENVRERREWFDLLKTRVRGEGHSFFDLLTEIKLTKTTFDAIHQAVRYCLQTCLGGPDTLLGEKDLLNLFEEKKNVLANITPNGVLLPKKEFNRPFNDLHRVFSDWVASLNLDDLTEGMYCPGNIRIVHTRVDPKVKARPYESAKTHLDVWAGDPSDLINILLPVLGDIERNSIEFFDTPTFLDSKFLGTLEDYLEGEKAVQACALRPLRPRMGYAYLVDALVPHRTVRSGISTRVSIDLRFRRKATSARRRQVESMCNPERLNNYLSAKDWHALGRSAFMSFNATYADAARGIFPKNPYDIEMFKIVPQLSEK